MDYIIFKEKSIENLRLSEIAFENSCYNGCANRAYFAMFQIAVACILKDGFSENSRLSHEKVISIFTLKYCNERKIFPQLSESLSDIQLKRNRADYQSQHINKIVASRTLKKAKEFVETVISKIFGEKLC